MTLWKMQFLYPTGCPAFRCSPVQNCRKFSHVFGAMSAKSSIFIRPTSTPPIATSKNTTGLFTFCGRRCHTTAAIACVKARLLVTHRPFPSLEIPLPGSEVPKGNECCEGERLRRSFAGKSG